jgi:hypothetical protein
VRSDSSSAHQPIGLVGDRIDLDPNQRPAVAARAPGTSGTAGSWYLTVVWFVIAAATIAVDDALARR